MSGDRSKQASTASDGAPEPARRLVLNPTSGDGDHVTHVRDLADQYGFPIVETERADHGVELAEAAACDGVDQLAVCGGDGTIHEVVRGLVAADALGDVTLCVIPAGTANIYASGLGIDSPREGLVAAELGETRQLDLGMAGEKPFVLSAIAGLPAEASVAASSDLKARLGTGAFLIEGLRTARKFDGLQVAIDGGDEASTWDGEALCLLISVLRRFTGENEPSNAETGRLTVTIVDRLAPTNAVAEAIEQRFLDRETSHVTTLETESLEVVALEDDPVPFSLDGERRTYDRLEFGVRPGALRVCVGAEYAG